MPRETGRLGVPVREEGGCRPNPLVTVPASEWDEQLYQASVACRIIDLRLDCGAIGRLLVDLEDFRPLHLSPEERVRMVTHLLGVCGGK